jgi:hypothetical protein
MLSRPAVWLCVAVLFAGVAWSQTSPSRESLHRFDVYAGYSRVAPSPFAQTSNNPADSGFGFGGDVRFSRWFAVAAEAHWMRVTYDAQDKSSSVTVFAGPRFFFPLGSHRAIIPFADVLGGVYTFGNTFGFNNPFSGTSRGAIAADGGVDVRIAGPFYLRAQGGFVHSSFSSPFGIDQPYVKNQHSRVLIEGVWRF